MLVLGSVQTLFTVLIFAGVLLFLVELFFLISKMSPPPE